MRFLLISDTHGNLGVIGELAARAQADAVIHAGDFGFFDDGSYERLSDRELRLHVAHSGLQQTEKARILNLPRNDLIDAARNHRLLGGFQSYLDGAEWPPVPVYAVWGNHEDRDVVERLFLGDTTVRNLNILHHRQGYRIGPAFVFGLGGNLLPGSRMMQRPIAGGGGKIWSTLSQYSDLVESAEKDADRSETRIFVSHVSPGREPFVELVGARTRADFTVSGHMGAPTCMIWNPFSVSSVEEAEKRLRDGLEAVRKSCLDAAKPDASWADQVFAFVGRIPKDTIEIGRGVKAPRWYRQMTHVNLPDAHVGYAVMDVDEESAKLQTFLR
ncbi:MAG: metallophosphoesterase [Actinomycetota bacterium]